MRTAIKNGQLPYALATADALTVTHENRYAYVNSTGRSSYAFIHVLEGQLDFQFPDDRPVLSLTAGQTVYMPMGCRYHCTYQPPKTTMSLYQFTLHPDSAQLPPQKPILLSQNVGRAFHNLIDSYGAADSFRCAATTYDLLGILAGEPPSIPRKYRRLHPALEALDAAPTASHPIEHYAQLCGMSEPGFRRSFTEYLGMKPVEYRNSLRLLHAKKLLASGEYSVEEAARQSGFNNLSFFYRLFRRKFGSSPGKF